MQISDQEALDLVREFLETHSYNRAPRDWRKMPELGEDPETLTGGSDDLIERSSHAQVKV